MDKVQRTSISGVFSLKWDIYILTPSQGLRTIEEVMAERLKEVEDEEDHSKALSSGYDRNSQELWLPAQDLYKVNPVSILAWSGEGLINLYP